MTCPARTIAWVLLLAACPADDADDETTAADDDSGSAGTTASTSNGSATTATSATGSESEGEGEGGTDTGTGSTVCSSDADCIVVNDCCTCAAFHVDDDPGTCDMVCDQSACSAQNLGDVTAQCQFGSCEIADIACNAALVACDALPPTCEAGWVPSVVGSCWGGCVRAEYCDVVPDCGSCPADEACIEHSVGVGATIITCRPLAPDCDGTPSCACMPGVCDQGADTCVDGEGTISCDCPNC